MRYKGFLIVGIMCLIGNSCAYYNTFYNAKTDYNSAMESKKNSPNQKAPPNLLNKVIEKCGKVIKYYPKSRWVDDAIMLMGKAYLEKGEYDKALRKFEELCIYYPKSPFVEEARYLIGVTYLQREDYNLAIGSFNEVLRMKKGKFEDASSFRIIETYYKKNDFNNLLLVGKDFDSSYSKSPYLPRALLLIGNTYMEQGNLEDATKTLRKARSTARKIEDKNDIDEKYAVALIKKGNIDEGLTILKNLSERSTFQERTAVLTFEIVNAYLQDNNVENALKELENYVSLYPTGSYSAEAFYRKGLIYEEKMGDAESAISTYDKALKLNPKEDIYALAAKRSSVLKEIKKYKEELTNPDSSTDLPKTHFLLAEVYLFDKENIDTALIEYRHILYNFPEDTLVPKAAVAIAWVYENERQDSIEAINMYKFIMKQFPGTEYFLVAAEAIERLGGERGKRSEGEGENGGVSNDEIRNPNDEEMKNSETPMNEGNTEEKNDVKQKQ